MGASTVPAVLDALVAAWADVSSELDVVDSGDYDPSSQASMVCVGWGGGQVDPVGGRFTPVNASLTQFVESCDISCLLQSRIGAKGTAKTVRDKAFGDLEKLRLVLAGDTTLGGLVMRAFVSQYGLAQVDDGTGLTATIPFTVHVEAMTA